jgi:hypothetical protein
MSEFPTDKLQTKEGYYRKVFQLTFAEANVARVLLQTIVVLVIAVAVILIAWIFYGVSLDTSLRSRFGAK